MFIELFDARSSASVGRDPVAVPEKIFGLTLILDFFDRCHSLVSLTPPQAAVDSLPTGRAETRCTIIRSRRGDYQSPVALWFSEEPSSNLVGAHPCVRPWSCLQTVPFIDTTVQTCNFAPLRGAFLSCVAKKGTKEGDLGEALRLCCGNTSTFRHYPRQPKFALPQDPLPRCAKMLHDTNRFLNNSTNFCLTEYIFQIRAGGTPSLLVISS